MARGSKRSYTSKQRRMASNIEESGRKRGMSSKRAKSMAYATVNKQTGGGKKSGSGRSRTRAASARKGSRTRSRR